MLTVEQLCYAIGISKQAYYAYLKSDNAKNLFESLIVDFVHSVRSILSRIGAKKLWLLHMQLFSKYGLHTIGRDCFFNILRRHNLFVTRRRSKKPHTTYSRHGYAVKPNLIKELEVVLPNQVWVTDMTFIWVSDKWCYLILVTDKYSRMIVGWEFNESHSHKSVQKAVDKALAKNKIHKPVILHSDRGSENCCHDLINYLQSKRILSSMTDADHCAQNALAERMNATMKQEFIPIDGYVSVASARAALVVSIHLYNTARPHQALGMATPIQVHKGDYNCKGERIKRTRGTTKSAGDVLESLLNNHPLFTKIRARAMA